MNRLEDRGIDINLRIYGGNKKDTIILLHGIGGTSSIWFRQLKLLKKYFRVIMIDLPSHGRSGDITEGSWSIKKCVSYLKREIRKLGIDRYKLMGVSLGTLLIHEWIKDDEERKKIDYVINVGTVIDFNVLGSFLIMVAKILKDRLPIYWLYCICAYILMPYKKNRESRGIFIKEAKKVGDKEFIKWFPLLDEVRDIYDKKVVSKVKSYYISGTSDYMFRKGLSNNVDKEHIKWLDGAGHVCNVDRSNEFNEILKSIIESNIRGVDKERKCLV